MKFQLAYCPLDFYRVTAQAALLPQEQGIEPFGVCVREKAARESTNKMRGVWLPEWNIGRRSVRKSRSVSRSAFLIKANLVTRGNVITYISSQFSSGHS